MRRGKMNKKSLIEWEESRVILREKDTSYHNLVPIVTNNGKVILMCGKKDNNNTKERKMIRLKSDDNGENWIEACNVENSPGDILSLGHGVCLDSGKLVIAGVENLDNNERKLFVMTSTDDGDTWSIVYAEENTENLWSTDNLNSWELLNTVKPHDATLGEHIQVVEYANDQVYISCSLENSNQRLTAYSNDGCETFEIDNELLEANPECQGGIVRLPTKTDEYYQIAMASHGNETKKDLTLYLSEDGCKTWCQFNTLGAVNARESDLAYYSVKEGKKEAEGIVCVYSYGSDTEGYKIGMQLNSNKEIM
ncbi:uncharacterized protein [Antedon mediterranea]|uniref:uncharacterized protein n=1 Tax=Antedon mediterranea TaxID=105859 RepID=UPI003AF79313